VDNEHRTIGELVRTVWFWLFPLSGGFVDWVSLVLRGLKPSHPPLKMFLFLTAHLCTAVFFGVLCVFTAAALGYGDYMALGAAGGMGGFLGIRLVDIFFLIVRHKSGGVTG
jgi:hypothetical protein